MIGKYNKTPGEVSEWSIVQPWKGCVGLSPPRVRISVSPPESC